MIYKQIKLILHPQVQQKHYSTFALYTYLLTNRYSTDVFSPKHKTCIFYCDMKSCNDQVANSIQCPSSPSGTRPRVCSHYQIYTPIVYNLQWPTFMLYTIVAGYLIVRASPCASGTNVHVSSKLFWVTCNSRSYWNISNIHTQSELIACQATCSIAEF